MLAVSRSASLRAETLSPSQGPTACRREIKPQRTGTMQLGRLVQTADSTHGHRPACASLVPWVQGVRIDQALRQRSEGKAHPPSEQEDRGQYRPARPGGPRCLRGMGRISGAHSGRHSSRAGARGPRVAAVPSGTPSQAGVMAVRRRHSSCAVTLEDGQRLVDIPAMRLTLPDLHSG